MDSITLKNYRCFREEQTARLAPLTLLVGENSTGKTSFLAILRALWDVGFGDKVPDFREDPYDLGAFEDIAYSSSRRTTHATQSFEAEFELGSLQNGTNGKIFSTTFKEFDGVPFPVKRKITDKETWFEADIEKEGKHTVRFGTSLNQWEYTLDGIRSHNLVPLISLGVMQFIISQGLISDLLSVQSNDAIPPTKDDLEKMEDLIRALGFDIEATQRPFSSAPIRSRPKRTYDPIRPSRDPEGEYIPTYLANLSRRAKDDWTRLKASLEGFGSDSGLFDEISVKSFGETDGDPFQVQIRKFGKRRRGIERNLIDVGYGISQALPLLTELLRLDAPQMFLLQQPEVHLHPSAQAALSGLFCSVAASGKQLIIETHSEYIIDRIRMDVRDKTTKLKPDDVSILYFERNELDVKVHSIRLDEMGNVIDAPYSYGEFFMAETSRSIGL